MKARRFYVYILSDHAGTLHVGVTSNLVLRVFEHKAEQRDAGVTGSGAVRLVYFESTTEVHAALEREKELKRWVRRKKRALIQAQASLPAAPPMNTSVKAKPAVVTLAPLPISRNGRNTRKPERVTLSTAPIASRRK